jgi:hypothetical protein
MELKDPHVQEQYVKQFIISPHAAGSTYRRSMSNSSSSLPTRQDLRTVEVCQTVRHLSPRGRIYVQEKYVKQFVISPHAAGSTTVSTIFCTPELLYRLSSTGTCLAFNFHSTESLKKNHLNSKTLCLNMFLPSLSMGV